MAEDAPKVNTPSAAFVRMLERWGLTDALMGSTLQMRDMAAKYLPKEDGEKDNAWSARVGRSFLFNAYADTVCNLAARPFADPVTSKNMPTDWERVEKRVDEQGRTLTEFSRAVFEDGIDRGLVHIMVDFPQTEEGLSLKEEDELGVRPFWKHIPATSVIGWQHAMFRGEKVLTRLRILETTTEQDPDNPWGEVAVERVRVYYRVLPTEVKDESGNVVKTPGEAYWDLYEITGEEEDFERPVETGPLTIGEIPLRTFYTARCGFMEGKPALEDLAWKNLEHFQSSSDQRNILRYARVPFVAATGFRKDEIDDKIAFGPAVLLRSTNKDAKAGWVEHSGKAIESGRQDLEDLKEEMVILGLKPLLLRRSGDQTATATAINENEENSELQAWVRDFEGVIKECADLSLRWMNVDPSGDDAGFDVSDEFTTVTGDDDIATLMELRKLGDISRHTLFEELKSRGVLAEEFDADAERERLQLEDQALADIEPDPEPDPEPAPEP